VAMLAKRLFEPLIRIGRLTIVDAYNRPYTFGRNGDLFVKIRLLKPSLHWKLCLNPSLVAGEAYMDGSLIVEEGTIYDFLDLVGLNMAALKQSSLSNPLLRASKFFRGFQQYNPLSRSRRNVAHHYDLSIELYDLFLDKDKQYSCAYFDSETHDLERAQLRKKEHIASKLRIEPGMSVLDIGSGWGGLALYLGDRHDIRVNGITLSKEQLKIARERATQAGLGDRVGFQLHDYRQETGVYDRIVSVGMFEHVGVNHYDNFFNCLSNQLADNGIALLHTIGRAGPPGGTNAWLRKYIFPGGYAPALSELVASIERTGLWVTDIEVLRLHYAETLRHWRTNFLAKWDQAQSLYDERFCRMWEFYLAACEVSFRHLRNVVFQVQITKQQTSVPIVRDYMVDAERSLSATLKETTDRAA